MHIQKIYQNKNFIIIKKLQKQKKGSHIYIYTIDWSSDLRFEWDENKYKLNIEKHDVSFREACTVFSDDDAIIFDDIDHSIDEDRFLIIGKSYKKNILYVCYCIRNGNTIRIISARKADKEEREDYYAHYESL